ncbi:MAG: DUF362 domain-containing protein [Candidatus Hydrothermarchaeota archaeon]|nr:DUF362 domain-containing protein [Candidatus Hydrothermarchaeota archaeon]
MVKVSIFRAEKPDVKRAINLIDFSPRDRETVVIKTNFCASYPGMDGSPMDLRILGQLLQMFENIYGERIVVDNSCPGRSAEEVFESYGVRDVCNYYGASLVDLGEDIHIPVKREFRVLRDLKLPRTLLKADALVNISVMKTSQLTGVALILKNIFDLIPEGSSRYPSKIEDAICDILRFKKPDLNIIDGITAIEGNRPKKMNLLLASEDPVALDTVSCKVMGINPTMIEHIVKPGFYNLGETLMQRIEVMGERIGQVRKRFIY